MARNDFKYHLGRASASYPGLPPFLIDPRIRRGLPDTVTTSRRSPPHPPLCTVWLTQSGRPRLTGPTRRLFVYGRRAVEGQVARVGPASGQDARVVPPITVAEDDPEAAAEAVVTLLHKCAEALRHGT